VTIRASGAPVRLPTSAGPHHSGDKLLTRRRQLPANQRAVHDKLTGCPTSGRTRNTREVPQQGIQVIDQQAKHHSDSSATIEIVADVSLNGQIGRMMSKI
jgi:hypothetical protein